MTGFSPATRQARAAKTSAVAAAKAEALIEDLEWLTKFRQSEYACLVAVGYAKKPRALKRQLSRLGRHDLIPKIFEWDASNYDRKNQK